MRPDPRPYIALGTMCALLYIMPFVVGFQTGKWTEASKMAGAMLILPAILFGPILWMRIEVDESEIRIFNFGRLRKRANFDEIGFSFPTVLAEEDWPLSLTIVSADGTSELLVIRMKVLRKEDVAWLLALPELKVRKR